MMTARNCKASLLLLTFVTACGGADGDVEYDTTGAENAPYSPAVLTEDLIFLSGQLGRAPGSSALEEGVAAQTEQIFRNMETVLARHGAGLDDLVKCSVFLADIADYGTLNETYAAQFTGNKPARTTVAVAGLPLNADVEIECIAARPE